MQNSVTAQEQRREDNSDTNNVPLVKLEYDKWNGVKINLELHGRQPNVSQGEIWWAGVGRNVGTEMHGKNSRFARPVLVYKKLSRYNFMAIPLTSKEHNGSWYVPFMQKGIREIAMLHQAKSMSIKRLYSRIGKIDEDDLRRVREAFLKLYS